MKMFGHHAHLLFAWLSRVIPFFCFIKPRQYPRQPTPCVRQTTRNVTKCTANFLGRAAPLIVCRTDLLCDNGVDNHASSTMVVANGRSGLCVCGKAIILHTSRVVRLWNLFFFFLSAAVLVAMPTPHFIATDLISLHLPLSLSRSLPC